jgi:poly-gamma-glutamate synthesis protein (capsule biosynthesis protein)
MSNGLIPQSDTTAPTRDAVSLFLCGDVMTGRGIDQILRFHNEPQLFEPQARSALEYVELAERVSGPIPRHVGFDYIWGDALELLEQAQPDGRIINLETAVTTHSGACTFKNVHYRMHPANVPCLEAAKIDCCVLANNHVLDWGRAGLEDTLAALHAAGIGTAGAGTEERSACSPGIVHVGSTNRVLVYGLAASSSGVPREWRASGDTPGVNWLESFSPRSAEQVSNQIAAERCAADHVVVSIHWGGNWGYEVAEDEREFAHRLVESGAVDLVHGHSSHHPKGMEIYRRKLILYGCGDFLNDYEGIGGYESFRPDLTCMYFAELERGSGDLRRVTLIPMRIRRFRVERAPLDGSRWLARRLNRECRRWGGNVRRQREGTLTLS